MLEQQWLSQLPLENISGVTPLAGGDVNQAYRIETPDCPYFLLVQEKRTADFYSGEIAGLKAFAAAKVAAPEVIANGQIDGDAYLLLSYLESGQGKQADVGRLLAKLHRTVSSNHKFGFSQPYEGSSMTFANTWTDTWRELFVDQRLDQLRDALVEKKLWGKSELDIYVRVRQAITDALDKHQSRPSLLHGDFWGGNHMFLADGSPALIDPSAFYGDREFDLGCSLVFGAYDQEFYSAYQAAYPLDEGYQQRLKFYSFYLLMIHLDKFGGMYANAVNNMMQQILTDFAR
ncbi:aminoglycoside phosphotransferase [Ligilactobacillus salitolerans]|uniref:Aminoglycoside phosphotransferase n=1 Tax=Ligilactobacillus salitolerans TaxID=1808352 RepID=A0A401IQI2_9LACO|nr:fructosamine kinase family protein [Ligilactobacillus salitolerans]GBG93792.1 aminoglycoside phosphotransferase [Ligilactobacillus salitolerans]